MEWLTFLPHPISPSQPHNAPSLCSAAAGKAKVARIFDLLVRAHLALRSARRALAADPSLLGTGDASWGSAGPFAVARATPLPLLLTHSL
ncbi:hypothetical protein AB1Y20_016251 [Prymnesium parvum]|uniref:Uncharacterized protein n=1 Tax=Prymnesium parvum TaxID=97485 RepID=A0AB34IEL1_PRYPA